MDITSVPRTARFVRGVINLRGKVYAVIDLRLKFGMPEAEPTDQTVIIVVQVQVDNGHDVTMGLMVDEVIEVLDIEGAQIEPRPSLGGGGDTELIMGIGKSGNRVIFLLDMAKVISADDVVHLTQVVGP